MTGKERWIFTIKMHPVDRILFWPKLDKSYTSNHSRPRNEMNIREMFEWIGSDIHMFIPSVSKTKGKKTSVETFVSGIKRETIYKTNYGQAREVHIFDKVSQAWHPVEYPIKTIEDIRLMTDVFSDMSVSPEKEMIEIARNQYSILGPDILVGVEVCESPFMYMIEWLAGLENAHYLVMDHPDESETMFEAIQQYIIKKCKIESEYSPADMLYVVENTSTTLISPKQYEKYCLKQVDEIVRTIRGGEKLCAVHMCGHLKLLLPMLSTLSADAFEAFTAPPVGDATLIDGRLQCKNISILGGTNCTMWLEDGKKLIEYLEDQLSKLPHHRGLVITSGGVMPPACEPEMIKSVCEFIKGYKARF